MATGLISWTVVVAGSGGVLVLIGLLMELEKDEYKNVSDLRRTKSRKFWGEWLVIFGIVVEIVLAGCTSINELELGKLKGRTITHSQESKLLKLLKPFSNKNSTILITFVPESSEARSYADRIAEVLIKCGFNAESKPSTEYDSAGDPFPTGLRFEEWGIQSTTLSEDILSAFNSDGIQAQRKIVKLSADAIIHGPFGDQKDAWFIRVWLKPEK